MQAPRFSVPAGCMHEERFSPSSLIGKTFPQDNHQHIHAGLQHRHLCYRRLQISVQILTIDWAMPERVNIAARLPATRTVTGEELNARRRRPVPLWDRLPDFPTQGI